MPIKYENSPPPSDFEYDDIEIPIFFTYPRPQNVIAPPFIIIDYSLIHPALLVSQSEYNSDTINENETNETGQEDTNNDVHDNVDENLKKVEQLNAIEKEKISLVTATDQNTNSSNIHKKEKEALKKIENCSKVKDKSIDVFQNGEHMCVTHAKNKRKHRKRIQSKRDRVSIDSDNESNINSIGIEVSGIESISKSYSKESETTTKDPDCSKSKSHKYLKSKYSKRNVVSDDDQSGVSERSKTSHYLRKCKAYKSISSDDDLSLLLRSKTPVHISRKKRISRSPEIKVKQEVFSDEDDSSYLRKSESFTRERFFESDSSTDNTSFYNRRHGKKCYDERDDKCYERCSPKKEVKQEVKREPMDSEDSKEFHGPDVYYCSFCKLSLNSELTWQSHLLGKRHAKALRAQSVHEVAKSSLLSSTYVSISEEGNRHDKPPSGMERIELKKAVSSIQKVCDDLKDRQVIGLRNVWEIRGEDETIYYCNLCDAPCAASSVMPHLIGYKHRFRCLKEYFPQIYDRFKDAHKKKIERIMELKFSNYRNIFRKEKVRVFKDIPISDYKKSSAYPSDQPGPSWQTHSQVNLETVPFKDENGKPAIPSNKKFLDTSFADFHCTVCDSHMNNISMWEAHIRGKRHLKNLKKDPQGLAASNKYVEAAPGTVSNLEKQIEEVCKFDDIIVGLNYIRENQGKQGNQYNCFPCGGCCSDIDIIDHILGMKHKIKILEKMHIDGFENSIMELNNIQVTNYFREVMVNEECGRMLDKYGRGKPQVYYLKRNSDLDIKLMSKI